MTAVNKDVVRRWLDATADKDGTGSLLALCDEGFICHGPTGTTSPSRDARRLRELFDPAVPAPGGHHYSLVAEGDKVAVLGAGLGTERRPAYYWLQVFRLRGGKVAETWLASYAHEVDWGPLPPEPQPSGLEEANERVLRRWWDEMYRAFRFDVLMPELAGPEYIRHEPTGSWTTTIPEHLERIKQLYPAGGSVPQPWFAFDLLAEGD